MEKLFEKLGWKKMAIFIVGVSLLMLFFVWNSFKRGEVSPKLGEQINETGTQNRKLGIVRTEEKSTAPMKYVSESFSISYPIDYQVVSIAPPSGIIERLKLVRSDGKEIVITVLPRQGNTVDDQVKPYQSAGYKGKVLNQNGMAGLYFEKQDVGLKFYEKVTAIQNGYTIIKVQLTYSGEKDFEFETQYDSMLATLR